MTATTKTSATADHASSSAHQAIDKASEVARPAVDDLASGAHHIIDKLAGSASHVAESLDLKGDQLQAVQSQLFETCRGHLREHPVVSLGLAVAVGYALSWLFRQR